MTSNIDTYYRILAISPSASGFGFIVLEGSDMLAAWGTPSPRTKGKNAWCLGAAEKLIRKFEPHAMVLYDHEKNTRRSRRIRKLNRRFADLAKTHKIYVKSFSVEQVKRMFVPDGRITKYEMAKRLAERMPEEIASKLPRARKPWDSEARRMGIFEAMALAKTFRNYTN